MTGDFGGCGSVHTSSPAQAPKWHKLHLKAASKKTWGTPGDWSTRCTVWPWYSLLGDREKQIVEFYYGSIKGDSGVRHVDVSQMIDRTPRGKGHPKMVDTLLSTNWVNTHTHADVCLQPCCVLACANCAGGSVTPCITPNSMVWDYEKGRSLLGMEKLAFQAGARVAHSAHTHTHTHTHTHAHTGNTHMTSIILCDLCHAVYDLWVHQPYVATSQGIPTDVQSITKNGKCTFPDQFLGDLAGNAFHTASFMCAFMSLAVALGRKVLDIHHDIAFLQGHDDAAAGGCEMSCPAEDQASEQAMPPAQEPCVPPSFLVDFGLT